MIDPEAPVDMTLEEAKAYLEGIGLVVALMKSTGDIRIRGATAKGLVGKSQVEILINPFGIFFDEQMWIAEFSHPFPIINASPHLKPVICAVENFFKLSGHREQSYQEIVMALGILHGYGITAVVDADLAKPSILTASTSQSKVENRYTFMLENAYLAQQTPEYRIYPQAGQWGVQSLLDEQSSPKIVPDVEQAARLVVTLCGRKFRP